MSAYDPVSEAAAGTLVGPASLSPNLIARETVNDNHLSNLVTSPRRTTQSESGNSFLEKATDRQNSASSSSPSRTSFVDYSAVLVSLTSSSTQDTSSLLGVVSTLPLSSPKKDVAIHGRGCCEHESTNRFVDDSSCCRRKVKLVKSSSVKRSNALSQDDRDHLSRESQDDRDHLSRESQDDRDHLSRESQDDRDHLSRESNHDKVHLSHKLHESQDGKDHLSHESQDDKDSDHCVNDENIANVGNDVFSAASDGIGTHHGHRCNGGRTNDGNDDRNKSNGDNDQVDDRNVSELRKGENSFESDDVITMNDTSNLVGRGVNFEETGRGKRKRKPAGKARFLESSDDGDDSEEFLRSKRQRTKSAFAGTKPDSNSVNRVGDVNTANCVNGQQKLKFGKCVSKTSSVTSSPVSAAATLSSAEISFASMSTTVTSSVASSSVAFSSGNAIDRRMTKDGSSVSGKRRVKRSSLPLRSKSPGDEIDVSDDVHTTASNGDGLSSSVENNDRHELNETETTSRDENAAGSDKQSQKNKELELEMRNENGEIEILTIIDIRSSSDDDEKDEIMAMNGEDDIIPVTDDDDDSRPSSEHKPRPDEVVVDQKTSSNVVSPRQPQDAIRRDDKGADLAAAKNADNVARVAVRKKQRDVKFKKRKKSRGGGGSDGFNSDVDANDKVQRLKRMYGVHRPTTKPVRSSGNFPSNPDKSSAAASSSGQGPYVRVCGPKDAPDSCRVMNVRDCDLDPSSSSKARRNDLLLESTCVPASLKTLDHVAWVCVFCGHGSGVSSLGDLFGPYYPRQNKLDVSNPLLSPDRLLPPQKPASARDARGAKNRAHSAAEKGFSGRSDVLHGSSSSGNLPEELWVHEGCVIWTSGVYFAGGKLRGLDEAAQVARQAVCTGCRKVGATLGCYMKGCSQNYHYLCAVKTGCFLRDENFSVLCPKHRDKGKKSKSTESWNNLRS